MDTRSRTRRAPDETRLVRRATAYDDDSATDDTATDAAPVFELPADLDAWRTGLADLDADELARLAEDARAAFAAVEGDADLIATDEGVAQIEALADAVVAVEEERSRRTEAAEENRQRAAAQAARVAEVTATDDPDDGGEEPVEEPSADATADDAGEEPSAEPEAEAEPDVPVVEERQAVAASSRRTTPLRIPIGPARRSGPVETATPSEDRTLSLIASGDLSRDLRGEDITIEQAAAHLHDAARRVNEGSLVAAARRHEQSDTLDGRYTEHIAIGRFANTPPAEGLVASGEVSDNEVMDRAVDESRLEGGSLVAAGTWCSPSETDYSLFADLESADGIISLPSIGITRGGLRYTRGPDFGTLFSDTGFGFTEAQAGEGEYDNGEEGPKPCFKVDCEDFVDERLRVNGVCITAGILQNRAYPELTARTIRGALVAHQHRIAGLKIGQIVAGSTAVTMPADQVGAAAPVLTAIELQTEHYRAVHRMSRSATLEVVLPFWYRGLVRSDLSRRLGVPLENVTDQVIAAHLATRNVNPQFVYNWQDPSGAAGGFTAWPSTIQFLIYAAGTWVEGRSDIVTLESVYDSALFTVNDFTALFTEEGWLVARRGHDSRVVTVPVCPSGATAGGVLIDCDGSAIEVNGD